MLGEGREGATQDASAPHETGSVQVRCLNVLSRREADRHGQSRFKPRSRWTGGEVEDVVSSHSGLVEDWGEESSGERMH